MMRRPHLVSGATPKAADLFDGRDRWPAQTEAVPGGQGARVDRRDGNWLDNRHMTGWTIIVLANLDPPSAHTVARGGDGPHSPPPRGTAAAWRPGHPSHAAGTTLTHA